MYSDELLTPVQQRNKLAFEIKKRLIQKQYGGKIQLIDTMDDILRADSPMAIPVQDLDTKGKQFHIPCAVVVEDEETGERYLAHDYGEMPVADDTIDVITVLRDTLDDLVSKEKSVKAKTKLRKKAQQSFEVPEGYKLVKIEEESPAPVALEVAEPEEAEPEMVDSFGVLATKKEAVKVVEAPAAEPNNNNDEIKQTLLMLTQQLGAVLSKLN